MDDVTAELLDSAVAANGGRWEQAEIFRELTRRNTRGPAMHRVDRVVVTVGGTARTLSVYVPVPAPSGVVVLLDRSHREGGNAWATESLARRIAERTSCEVVTADAFADAGSGFDDEPDIAHAVAVLNWCVTDRRDFDPSQTAALVVLGQGAGGFTAARLMSREHYESVGRHVSSWVLVSPDLNSSEPEVEPVDLSPIDRCFWETVRSRHAADAGVDVVALANDAAADTAPVAAHIGGDLDQTAPATRRFVAALSDAGISARAYDYPGQINGFFSIMSIPAGERTLQSVIRTVRASVVATQRRGAGHE